jgi:hypothetical protein
MIDRERAAMTLSDQRNRHWRKSTFSGGSGDGQCVEVAHGRDDVSVRDSKSADGEVLDFSSDAWHSFVGIVAA